LACCAQVLDPLGQFPDIDLLLREQPAVAQYGLATLHGPGHTLAGASVILLEAGPRIPRWQIVENFRDSPAKSDFVTPYPSTSYAPHPEYTPANHYLIQKGDSPYNAQYLRLVGGTTWHWAAAAWRLLPSDFQLHNAEADADVDLRSIPARHRQQFRPGGPQPDGSSRHGRDLPRQLRDLPSLDGPGRRRE
jgi:hypothetical protein